MKFQIQHCLILIVFSFCTTEILAQKQTDKRISCSFENKTLTKILYELSEDEGLRFYFDPNEMPSFPITAEFEDEQVYVIMQEFLNGTQLKVIPYKNDAILILNQNKINAEAVKLLVGKWEDGTYDYPLKNESKKVIKNFGSKNNAVNEKIEVAIKVYDEQSMEPLIGALLTNQDRTIIETSNLNGAFDFSLPAGEYEFIISYTGYQEIQLTLKLYQQASFDLPIAVQAFQFDEVEVIANSLKQKLDNSKAGLEKLSMEELKFIPQVTGDIDLLKSLEVIPGITSTTELSQGFNIRGGSTDQNLILLNDGIIFNPSHVLGFISAFNPDIVSEANLYKGYVDASFGGRVSGVLDIKTDIKEVEKWSGKGGIGISILKLYVAGKLNEKLNVKLAARGSFNDYLLKSIANVELQNSSADFYDVNANAQYKIGEKHSVFFNNYYSKDYFEYNNDFGFEWSNFHSGLQMKSNWKNDFYSKLSLNVGNYKSENFTLNKPDAFRFINGFEYFKGLLTLDKKIDTDGFARIGIEYLTIRNQEDVLKPENSSTLVEQKIQRLGATNVAPFLSLSKSFLNSFNFETGIRFSILYPESGLSKEINFEPRISISYKPGEAWAIKSSYNRMSQFIYQFSNTNSALPSDIWSLSNEDVLPNLMDQYSLGLVHLTGKKTFEYSLDLFYKDFENLYELKDFAQIVLNDRLQDELIDSEGESYGVEFLVKKQKGKWQGSLAYTYSRSFRKSVGLENAINQGESFPASFDIPHQLNVLAIYKWLPVVSFNFAYIYRSGAPTTAPNASFIQDGFLVPLYSNRNEERIPYYARLDFAINLDLRKSKKNGFRNSFNLGFYNLLGRKNPTNVFFRRSSLGNIVPFQFSVVGAVIPNFSWNFVF